MRPFDRWRGRQLATSERGAATGHRTLLGAARAPAPSWVPSGPFTRWPRVSDALLAVAVFLSALFFVDDGYGSPVRRSISEVSPVMLAITVVACGALYRRRHEPVAMLAVVLTAAGLALTLGNGDLSGVAVIAVYSVGRYADRSLHSHAAVGAVVAFVVVAGFVTGMPGGSIGLSVAVAVLAWYVGRQVRLRGVRIAERDRERAAESRRVVAEERARIARELHDVVAHRVSLITVQAGAAKTVVRRDPEGARRAMDEVENVGRQALGELRHLLDVLRPETESDTLGPQLGLADVPRLVETMAEAGLDVTLTMDTASINLVAQVDLSAYRIVQEALTNVIRHAGPGTPTEVRIGTTHAGAGGDRVSIEVLDRGREVPVAHGTGAGHGIVGMRERATLLGGTLTAERHPGGGFRVVAELPIGAEP